MRQSNNDFAVIIRSSESALCSAARRAARQGKAKIRPSDGLLNGHKARQRQPLKMESLSQNFRFQTNERDPNVQESAKRAWRIALILRLWLCANLRWSSILQVPKLWLIE